MDLIKLEKQLKEALVEILVKQGASKEEAEKILKAENEKAMKASSSKKVEQKKDTKSATKTKKTS